MSQRDTEILRQLYAQGRSDADIAYILSRDRGTVRAWRRKLGLGPPKGVPGGKIRGQRSPEQRAKIAASMVAFWQTRPDRAEAAARSASYLSRACSANSSKRYRQPAKGTPERKLYRKIQEAIGTRAARAAWLAGQLSPVLPSVNPDQMLRLPPEARMVRHGQTHSEGA